MHAWTYDPAHDLDTAFLDRWRNLHREGGLVSRCLQSMWHSAVSAELRIMHNLRVDGLEHLPARPPFVLAANHTSHLDALALAASLPPRLRASTFSLAAGDVFFDRRWRAALAAHVINALPVWRFRCGPGDLKSMRQRLIGDPCGYILFPEGVRSRDGDLKPFKAGVGMMVAGLDVPVIPAWIEGAGKALPPGANFPRRRPVSISIGAPLHFADRPNRRAGWVSVAADLSEAVSGLKNKAPAP